MERASRKGHHSPRPQICRILVPWPASFTSAAPRPERHRRPGRQRQAGPSDQALDRLAGWYAIALRLGGAVLFTVVAVLAATTPISFWWLGPVADRPVRMVSVVHVAGPAVRADAGRGPGRRGRHLVAGADAAAPGPGRADHCQHDLDAAAGLHVGVHHADHAAAVAGAARGRDRVRRLRDRLSSRDQCLAAPGGDGGGRRAGGDHPGRRPAGGHGCGRWPGDRAAGQG